MGLSGSCDVATEIFPGRTGRNGRARSGPVRVVSLLCEANAFRVAKDAETEKKIALKHIYFGNRKLVSFVRICREIRIGKLCDHPNVSVRISHN